MSRRSELLTSLPARSDDCFAQFDAVFNSLATELAWSDVSQEQMTVPPAQTPAAPVVSLALVTRAGKIDTSFEQQLDQVESCFERQLEAGVERRIEDAGTVFERGAGRAMGSEQVLDRFEDAFDLLDTQLAQIDQPRSIVPAKANAPAVANLLPVYEVDSSWFGEGVDRLKGVAPPPVQQQVRLAPSPNQLRHSRPFTHGGSRRQLPGGRSPLENILGLLDKLSVIQGRLAQTPHAAVVVESVRDAIANVLAGARQLCLDLDLQTARVRTDFALQTLEEGRFDKLTSDIEELVRHIRRDLRSCSIWPIATSRVWALNLTFGPEVNAAFPSSQPDIAEGGICFGLARYTASVFHMVRAAERGLRALAVAADAKARVPQHDQGCSTLITIVEARIAQIETWPAGLAKARAQEFFQGALDDAKALKESARKLAAGGRARSFDEHEALSICHKTRDLLVRLSQRISEAQDHTLGQGDFSR